MVSFKVLLNESYRHRLWLERDYESLLEQTSEKMNCSVSQLSERYGELNIVQYCGSEQLSNRQYLYSDQFGVAGIKKS